MKIFYSKTQGFLVSSIHMSIPDDAVEIGIEQHQQLLAGQSVGKHIKADKHGLPILIEPTPPNLEMIKAGLKNRIDAYAENERLKYITGGDGQARTYQEKVNQAAEYSGAFAAHMANPENVPEPDASLYPLLAASMGTPDGNTLLEIAETVTYSYLAWLQISAAIETVRLQSKAAIDGTDTAENAQMIFDGIVWPKRLLSNL